jgi:hypothetical protein
MASGRLKKKTASARSYVAGLPIQVRAGALVFVMAFGLFSFTTQPLTGYEPETAAVTEGLVLEGHFWDKEDSPLPLKANFPGKGGHYYSTAGLLQPLLEVPFFAAGHVIDANFGYPHEYPFGYVFLWFYNPFVAAIAAVALFALIFMTRRSIKWAAAIASLFVVASIAWPYSKIGMETTFMAAALVAFTLAVWARGRPTVRAWALTGLAAGAAIATKPYAVVVLAAIAIVLWPPFKALDWRQRRELALAICLPVLAWIAAIAWYNWVRFGSPTDSGYHESLLTLTAPFNVLGLLFSPGKGLIFYSPLVVLGALGLPKLWRQDRSLALALLVLLLGLTCIAGSTTFWGDEVWGPRYIVPTAWALLVPIAWWADTAVRRKVLVGVASLGVLVQIVAVSAQYAHYVDVVDALTGVPVYQDRFGVPREDIPYGNDPTRWIPELSALLIQTEGLISSQVVDRLGGHGLEVTYSSFEGRSRTVNLSDPKLKMPPDFWWYPPPEHRWLVRFIALLILLASAAAATRLYLVTFGRLSLGASTT